MHRTGIPLLDAIDTGSRADLLDRMVPRRVDEGSYLHFAGQPADFAYFVTGGALLLCARDSAGNETSLGLALPGDLVDEAGVVASRPHDVDAIASTTVHVVAIDAASLHAAIAASPTAAIALTRHLDARLAWTRRAAQERATGTVAGRVATHLLDLGAALGHDRDGTIELTLPVDQARLATLAGASREMTCRTLRRFKAGGILDYEGRALRILRPDVLERLRCGAVRNAARALPQSPTLTRAARGGEPSPLGGGATHRRSRSMSGT